MIDVRKLSISVACALALPGGAVWAQSGGVSAAIGEQVKAEEAAVNSQAKITKLDDEATSMLSEYRQALAEVESLKAYNDQLALQVKSQDEEVASANKQLADIETTSREVMPLMANMLDTLDKFVKLDVPFQPEERAKRVESLKTMMARADVSLSEKYRRLVEAYQIEMEYGRTVEAYQGKVDDKMVDFLRAGRIALMYQTLDGLESGYWDAAAKSWKTDNDYGHAMTDGLKIAKKQSAPDFLFVPVPAPTEIK